MSIAEKLQTIAENEQKVFEAGRKSQYDEFWDGVQNFGNRTYYYYGFIQWGDESFYPKYDIKPTSNAGALFSGSRIVNLKQRLIDCGVILDTSKANGVSSMFSTCYQLTHVPTIDTTSAQSLGEMFNNAQRLIEIEKLVLKDDGTQTLTNTFRWCNSLQNIVIEGVIGNAVSFVSSTKLSRNSILSILQACKISVSTIAITLPIKCIDTNTDTLALIESDTELNTAYNNALALGYTITFA